MEKKSFLATESSKRGSRQLSFGQESEQKKNFIDDGKSEKNRRLSKNEILDIYKTEIDEIIKESKNKLATEFELTLKRELAAKEKELISHYKEKSKLIEEKNHSVTVLLDSLNEKFDEICKSEIVNLDTLVVELCFEILYKITGNSIFYKETLNNLIKDSLVKKINDFRNLTIKISKEDYLFYKSNFSEEEWFSSVKVDDGLSTGQVVFDDGFSLYECGLLDQLDSLRSEFIAALRKNNE